MGNSTSKKKKKPEIIVISKDEKLRRTIHYLE